MAVVLVLASIYALVRFAGRVYGRGLLHGGPRIDLRTAWRVVLRLRMRLRVQANVDRAGEVDDP